MNQSGNASSGTMLVLSDDPRVRRELRDALHSFATRVMIASTIAEAAKCLAAADVQLAVVAYPDAQSASKVLEHLRQHTQKLAAVTTGGAEDSRTVVVSYPIDKQALHHAMQRLSATMENAKS